MTYAEEFIAVFKQGADIHPDDLEPWNGAEQMSETYEIVGSKRWSNTTTVVYRFVDDSFVRFTWDEPATEMQEGQELNTRVKVVIPKTVETVIYVTPEEADLL